MKNVVRFLLSSMLAFGAWAEVRIGAPAPDFTARDINGKVHRLSDYRGKIVVLEAYNLDCPFCANHYKTGSMQSLQDAVTSKGGIWLVVNSTHKGNPSYRTSEAARKEFDAQGIKATAWLDDSDGKVGKLYGMKTTPHMFVIDPAGNLAYQGAIDDRPASSGDPRTAKNYVKLAVEALVAGKAVPVAETKPYGCSVKYAE
ncbi:MAG: redoxin domain-containing protein [Candidatus Oleimicrobiaceae bacterium]